MKFDTTFCRFLVVRLFLFSLCFSLPAFGAIVQINGKYCDDKFAPTMPLHEHYDQGYKQVQERNWEEGLHNFLVITTHYPESPFYSDALFYAGVCRYFLNDLELANKCFSNYLNQKTNLKHFEKVFLFKFQIAEGFRQGAKKRLFNVGPMPKLLPAKEEALAIYDEVISALPHNEVAAEALYSKGVLLGAQRKYKDAVDALIILTKRFPTHPKSVEAYLLISDIYLEESKRDTQNPDLLALAKIQVHHFRQQFPAQENIAKAESNLGEMGEVFAKSLYDTGRFYERKKKPLAAKIYYQEALKNYPESGSAKKCNERLALLK